MATDQPKVVKGGDVVEERLMRVEERLGALEREVELLRELVRSLSGTAGRDAP